MLLNNPFLSVVIPVYNEEANLHVLTQRLVNTLDALSEPYEIIYVNDGSVDKSSFILHQIHDSCPADIKIIEFNKNYGQHMAIMAGFEQVRGQIIITLDADLQNPPEEIPKLVTTMKQGFDVVNTYRQHRQDPRWRKGLSKLHNKMRTVLIPQLKMKDEGCMLRAYSREIVNKMINHQESSTFLPALALYYASHPTEIAVQHHFRLAGKSSYNFLKLIQYNFDLIINFSNFPLQIFIWLGVFACSLSLLAMILFISHVIPTQMRGLYLLLSFIAFLLGSLLMSIGIIGEYIGRIYQVVRKRPGFVTLSPRKNRVGSRENNL